MQAAVPAVGGPLSVSNLSNVIFRMFDERLLRRKVALLSRLLPGMRKTAWGTRPRTSAEPGYEKTLLRGLVLRVDLFDPPEYE